MLCILGSLAHCHRNQTNITGIVDGLAANNNEALTYTDAARLSGATSGAGSYGTRLWSYDNNGNRLTETANGVPYSYTYPANSNRLTSVKQGANTTRAFTYDAAGNQTQDLRGATAYNYAVNNAGRIRTLTIGTTLRATWVYDGFQKLRVKAATTPVATTHYVWDNFGHIISEHNGVGGGALKQYIWLGDTPLAVFDGANLFYVHPDHLDRPVMMTNSAAQTIAWAAKYDPFGNPVTVTVSPVNNQRLPGQWFQAEDGLAYNWHRTYDPTLGRYYQADPLGFVDGPGIYNYAYQSPLVWVDPTGESGVGVIGGAFAADFFTPDPTDVIPQKWIGWGVAFCTAVIIEGGIYMSKPEGGKKKYEKPKNPNQRKGAPDRAKTGDRERNIGHPDEAEHSIKPKGGLRRR